MIWLTRLREWWRQHQQLCKLRRALIEGDPEVKRLIEEYGQRKLK